jgi:hypothetical protein
MNQTGTTYRIGLAVELACLQTLALSLVLGGQVLERFGRLQWLGLGIALVLNLLFLWTESKRLSRTAREEDSRNAAIDSLYAELRQLMSQPGADSEIEQRLARLRTLQQEEAAAMRQRYEARGQLKSGTGWQALSEARKLLSENENPPSSNPTLQRPA